VRRHRPDPSREPAPRERRRSALCAVLVALAAATLPGVARGVDALDGLIEAHGSAEIQVRALDSEFSEELDLAQWYNVFGLEMDLNFAPDGIGPLDLFSGFVRAEVRYDCVYTRGCGMLRSADTYGNRAKRLPERLRSASDPDYSGVIPPLVAANFTDQPHLRNPGNAFVGGGRPRHPEPTPSRFAPYRDADGRVITDSGFPGADTLFRQEGADSTPNSGDEPADYTFAPIADFRFAFKHIRDNAAGGTYQMGPWLPKNTIVPNGALIDRANPFRGRYAAGTDLGLGQERYHVDDLARAIELRNNGIDPETVFPGIGSAAGFDQLHPELVSLLATDDDLSDCLPPNVVVTDTQGVPRCYRQRPINSSPGSPLTPVSPISEFFVSRANSDPLLRVDPTDPISLLHVFGGDWNPTLPCRKPTDRRDSDGYGQRLGGFVGLHGTTSNDVGSDAGISRGASGACIPDGAPDPADPTWAGPNTFATLPGVGTNRRITGGAGENPFRPAPSLSNLGTIDPVTGQLIDNSDRMQAQGLYYPSAGLRREFAQGNLNDLDFNYTQGQRALNRGQAQQEYKELKEAYLEAELLDSRLWVRLGLQNIVWGKTELFRTTDQFNPVDLALASLPTLEEQRIALWSGRFVYSFYDVWQFNDVRAEFAFNWDRFQPNDLGACGEPFTPDLVCNITLGMVAHGLFGVGVAGVDRPEKPWDDLSKGTEFGGRVEWRWDRFSFALSDFFGYEDVPYPDMIFFYERNVDANTGRPRIAESRGSCTAGTALVDPTQPLTHTALGVGTDPDCLKPGLAGSPQNALEFHHANQQIFAVLCSATTGIAASLDAGACAFNIFASNALLRDTFVPDPNNPGQLIPVFPNFVEVISAWFAGEQAERIGVVMSAIQDAQFPSRGFASGAGSISGVPTRALNRDDGRLPGQPAPPGLLAAGLGDGNNTYTSQYRDVDPDAVRVAPLLSLDSTLTSFQRALFGCGPFYATRCDSSVPTRDGAPGLAGDIFGRTGGVDFLNTEASALVQAWPGIEGTGEIGLNGYTGGLWTTTDRRLTQPGTAGFEGGPICTRNVDGRIIVLPGCRGIARPDELRAAGSSANPFELVDAGIGAATNELVVTFQDLYDPRVDGCIFAPRLRTTLRDANGEFFTVRGRYADGSAVDLSHCDGNKSDTRVGDQADPANDRAVLGARTEFHPLAGCWENPTQLAIVDGNVVRRGDDGLPCPAVRTIDLQSPVTAGANAFRIQVDHDGDPNTPHVTVFVDQNRDGIEDTTIEVRRYQDEFINSLLPDGDPSKDPNLRPASVFQSEAAAVSWNILMLLVASSCNEELDDRELDLDCFDYRVVDGVDRSYLSTRCSFAAPHLCRNTKGFLALAGTMSRRVEAAGNGRYGRRTFSWHGGQEVVLRYQRRNVLGFSSDFAEDMTKTNWGMEFTWIGKSPFADAAEFDGITRQETLNLTLSVDRPTFINFLNANRTFFFNSQWFFQYQTKHRETFSANGPWNVLFTTAIQTGYYQDRLQPELITVYDFNSRSGAILPSIGYRFTDAFSIRWGFLVFFGRTELEELPVNPISPPANRADPNAYQVPVENALSLVRDRDEVFFRLRYTF